MRHAEIKRSFFSDITEGRVYELLDRVGDWIVTDIGVEYNLAGDYNQENLVVSYKVLE